MPVRLSDFPQLKLIAWSRQPDDLINEDEALALYERNWRYVDAESLSTSERQFIERLVQQYGHGVLHV